MAESEDIPSFKFTPKTVDDSWKEEIRRERERAAAETKGGQAQPEELKSKPAQAGADAGAAAHADHAAAPEAELEAGADEGAQEDDADSPAPAAAEEAPQAAGAAAGKKAGTSAEQLQSKIFMTFLAGLAQQAMMQLGAMPNPYTGQAELDLNGARYTIDLLTVILAKTKGNLTRDEEQALVGTIQDLKYQYAELAAELQRQMAEQVKQAGPGGLPGMGGSMRPGPGGAIPGPGFGRRR